MSKREKVWGLSLALLGTLLGTLLPVSTGCRDNCELDLREGSYVILDDREDWSPGSGLVNLSATTILIQYETTDGSRWEVEYVITGNDPPGW